MEKKFGKERRLLTFAHYYFSVCVDASSFASRCFDAGGALDLIRGGYLSLNALLAYVGSAWIGWMALKRREWNRDRDGMKHLVMEWGNCELWEIGKEHLQRA